MSTEKKLCIAKDFQIFLVISSTYKNLIETSTYKNLIETSTYSKNAFTKIAGPGAIAEPMIIHWIFFILSNVSSICVTLIGPFSTIEFSEA